MTLLVTKKYHNRDEVCLFSFASYFIDLMETGVFKVLASSSPDTQWKFAHSGDCGGGRRRGDTTSSGLRRIFGHKGENVGKGDRGIRLAKT